MSCRYGEVAIAVDPRCGTGGRWFEPTQLYHNTKIPCGFSIVLIDLTYLLALNTKSATNGNPNGLPQSHENW
jgi:hypothetical protein